MAVSALALMVTVGGLLAPGSGLLALVPLGVIAAVVGLVAYGLLRRGHLGLASYVFLLGTSVAITSNVFVRGFQDVSGIYYLWPILGAVFLLGTRGGITVTAVSAFLYLGLVGLQSLGIQSPPLPVDLQAEGAFVVVSRLLMFFLLAFLGGLVSQNLDRTVQQSRQAGQKWRDLSETLEQRVAERTRDLEHRALQLATVADVGRAASSILDLDILGREVVDLVRDRFDLYYVGFFLLDDGGEYAVLEAGSGEAGRLMKEQGHKLRVGGVSMVGSACAQKEACVALEAGAEAVRFDNPLLPETRSEVALPLTVGERVLGALDAQSTEPAAFSEEDITVLQLVADQVAVAVDNAYKFSEEAEILSAADPLFRISRRLARATRTGDVVEAILSTVAETEADGCAVARLDFSHQGDVEAITFLASWSRREIPRMPVQVSTPLGGTLPLPLVTNRAVIEDVSADERIPDASRDRLLGMGMGALAILPLRVGERTIGFFAVDRSTPGPFSMVSLRLYETLAEQAAVALERARLLEESQQQAWREYEIRDIGDRVTASLDLETLLQETVEEVGRMVGAAGGYVELGMGETWPEEPSGEG
jgi:GAF domain-containing protein